MPTKADNGTPIDEAYRVCCYPTHAGHTASTSSNGVVALKLFVSDFICNNVNFLVLNEVDVLNMEHWGSLTCNVVDTEQTKQVQFKWNNKFLKEVNCVKKGNPVRVCPSDELSLGMARYVLTELAGYTNLPAVVADKVDKLLQQFNLWNPPPQA